MVTLSYEEASWGKLILCIFLRQKLVYYGLLMKIGSFLFHFNAIDLKAFIDSPELWRVCWERITAKP
jgi:hypothetical protein